METPLGRTVGNSLEILECLDVLKGHGPEDLADIVRRLAARMIVLSGVEADAGRAARLAAAALASGRALAKFVEMVTAQGGDPRIVDDPSRLPLAPGVEVVAAPQAGIVNRVSALRLGQASHALGAGRATVADAVDHGVGLRVLAPVGSRVEAGQPLVELRHRDGRGLDIARALCAEAVRIADTPPAARPTVIAEVR
jgi:pyrimidine-nucleoside phosphorylase/thymidine phosphorylase